MDNDQLELAGFGHEAEQMNGQTDIFGQLADLDCGLSAYVEATPAERLAIRARRAQ